MVRRLRVEIEGGLYHVYNRIASGEQIFSDPEEAAEFIETIRETKTRDGWTVRRPGSMIRSMQRNWIAWTRLSRQERRE